jgi:hypothetical protein
MFLNFKLTGLKYGSWTIPFAKEIQQVKVSNLPILNIG